MLVDNVNNHIQHALALGWEAGFKMPEILFKGNLSEEQVEALESDYHWETIDNAIVFRPDGEEISYITFWNGEKFVLHTIFINDRYLMNDSQGDKIPANCVTCFAGKLDLNRQLNKIAEELKTRDSGWKGFLCLDLILNKGIIHFKDIKFSVLEDYIYCLAALNNSDIETLIGKLETGEALQKPSGYACSMRLYSYPYDPVMNKYTVRPFIDNLLPYIHEAAESYLLVSRDTRVRDLWRDLLRKIPLIASKYGVCFRTDGDKKARQIVNILNREHYIS